MALPPYQAQMNAEQLLAYYLAASGQGAQQQTAASLGGLGAPSPYPPNFPGALGAQMPYSLAQVGAGAAAASTGIGMGNLGALQGGFDPQILAAIARGSSGGGGGGGGGGGDLLQAMANREDLQARGAELAFQRAQMEQEAAAKAAEDDWNRRLDIAKLSMQMMTSLGGQGLDIAKLGLDADQFNRTLRQRGNLARMEERGRNERADEAANAAAGKATKKAQGEREDLVSRIESWVTDRALALQKPYYVTVPKPNSPPSLGKTIRQQRTRTRQETAKMIRQELAAKYRNELRRYGVKGKRVNEIVNAALAGAYGAQNVVGGSNRPFGPAG